MKLVILAAGLGSRFGGVKQLASIGAAGETLLEYNVYNALEAGFDSVVFLIRKDIEADFRTHVLSRLPLSLPIELAFQDAKTAIPERIRTLMAGRERVKPWGTGHALLCTRNLLEGGAFAVINADDFYGMGGFVAVHDFLGAARGKAEFCLAGYRLGGVVSQKGSVSRAICSVGADGSLEKIVEHTKIVVDKGGIRSIRTDGVSELLSPDVAVSMNLWGLTPAIFPWAERLFEEFLADPAHWATSEFYLPTVVGDMIGAKAARVRALPVDEEYFGLTNPDDIFEARRTMAGKIGRGEYPSPLWEDYESRRKN